MKSARNANRHAWHEIVRGCSLNRALRDSLLKTHVSLSGRVLDIGGGHLPYYWKFFPDCEFVSADMSVTRNEDIKIDLEKPLPIASAGFDGILCLSVLEHIWDYSQLIRESRRIKKPDAPVYFWIPFMMQPHGAYGDFFRYTDSALERMFAAAGFSSIEVISLSNYFWVLGNLLSQPIYEKRYLRPVTVVSNALLLVFGGLLGRFIKGSWPIGYLVTAY